jgi:hypothetical protein
VLPSFISVSAEAVAAAREDKVGQGHRIFFLPRRVNPVSAK